MFVRRKNPFHSSSPTSFTGGVQPVYRGHATRPEKIGRYQNEIDFHRLRCVSRSIGHHPRRNERIREEEEEEKRRGTLEYPFSGKKEEASDEKEEAGGEIVGRFERSTITCSTRFSRAITGSRKMHRVATGLRRTRGSLPPANSAPANTIPAG